MEIDRWHPPVWN